MNSLQLLTVLSRASAQAGVVVLLILAAQWIFRRQLAPRWRCALWLILVVRLLLPISPSSTLSIFNFVGVAATKAVAGPADPTPAVLSQTPAAEGMVAMISSRPPAVPRLALASAFTAAGLSSRFPSWPGILLGGWLVGVGLLLGHLAVTSRRFARSLAGSSPVTDPAVLGLLRTCRSRLGAESALSLLETGAVSSPALYGFLRPRLLLPPGFCQRLSPQELQFVFLHELAHLKRRDLPLNWLMVLLQIIHWFNPLVWLGFARWRADRELACDALTLEVAGAEQARPYGETILRLLEEISSPIAAPGLVGILEDPGQLRQRIRMIGRFRPKSRWSALGLVLVAIVAFSSLSNARDQDPVPKSSPAGEPTPPLAQTPPTDAVPGPFNHAPFRSRPTSLYKLLPQDQIHIAFFREVTLDTNQRIDAAGNVSLAIIGDIRLAGLTLSEARKAVEDAYRKTGVLPEPVGVSMTIEQYSPREVSIQGAVKNPGRFMLPPESTTSVVELVSKAGGFTDIGKGNSVRIIHVGGSRSAKSIQYVDVAGIIEGRSSISPDDPSLVLADGDIVFVPEKIISDPEPAAPANQPK